jgi:hypothetical protein
MVKGYFKSHVSVYILALEVLVCVCVFFFWLGICYFDGWLIYLINFQLF